MSAEHGPPASLKKARRRTYSEAVSAAARALERLYAVAPRDFTRARNALAAELRAPGFDALTGATRLRVVQGGAPRHDEPAAANARDERRREAAVARQRERDAKASEQDAKIRAREARIREREARAQERQREAEARRREASEREAEVAALARDAAEARRRLADVERRLKDARRGNSRRAR